jgi:hypothetical protein
MYRQRGWVELRNALKTKPSWNPLSNKGKGKLVPMHKYHVIKIYSGVEV